MDRTLVNGDIRPLVKILEEDPEIFNRIDTVMTVFGVPPAEKITMTKRYDMGVLSGGDCLTKILEIWISKNADATFLKLIQILKNAYFMCSAGRIQEIDANHLSVSAHGVEEAHRRTRIWPKNIPKIPNFIGREDELRQLHDEYDRHRDDGYHPTIVYIHGIGGIGKTSLAVKFCYNIIKKFPRTNCVFLDVESIHERLIRHRSDFVSELKESGIEIEPGDKSVVDVANKILNKMGPSIILVLENASPDCTHVSDLLRDIINCQNFDMFVVVNSRGSNFSFPGKSIALNTFSDENGWEYAHFLLPRKNKADIVALCNIVDNIPLAISTVLACFKMERCGSLVLFNKTFKSDMDKRIAYYRTSQVDSTSYDGNIYAVIAHTLDLITKQDSGMHVKTILSFLICLRPTKVMRREDLQNFFLAVAEGVVDPEIEFDKALATLENYSLFVSDSDETNLVMHDVIFHVVLHHFGWHVEEDHLLFHVPRQVFQLLGNNFSKLSPRNQATFAIFVLNRMRNNKCVGVYRFGSLVIQM